MKKHALLIGVNIPRRDTGDTELPSLLFAEDDARKLGDMLRTELGFNVRQLLGAEATKATLEESLTSGTLNGERLEPDDLFLFYFAGHGTTTHFSGQYYLHCYGATLEHAAGSLLVGWLVQFLHSRDFGPRRTLLIFDACRNIPPVYQGHRGADEATDGACLHRDIVTAQRREPADGPSHTVGVLYGCEPQGMSQEDPEQLRQGVLAYHLMESLRSENVRTLSDWVDAACERCAEWTQEQAHRRQSHICLQRPWPEGTTYLRNVFLREAGKTEDRGLAEERRRAEEEAERVHKELEKAQRHREEDQLFAEITTAPKVPLCERYLELYPGGRYVTEVKEVHHRMTEEIERNRKEAEIMRRRRKEDQLFTEIKTHPRVPLCKRYLELYPRGLHVCEVKEIRRQVAEEKAKQERRGKKKAQKRYAEDQLWGQVKSAPTIPLCERYIQLYPDGRYVHQAKKVRRRVAKENLERKRGESEDARKRVEAEEDRKCRETNEIEQERRQEAEES
ncbi:MAG: caspase family protein [Phycisphaerae bacterium]|nr:caspase family protein [Phycisphaerae bacterium]